MNSGCFTEQKLNLTVCQENVFHDGRQVQSQSKLRNKLQTRMMKTIKTKRSVTEKCCYQHKSKRRNEAKSKTSSKYQTVQSRTPPDQQGASVTRSHRTRRLKSLFQHDSAAAAAPHSSSPLCSDRFCSRPGPREADPSAPPPHSVQSLGVNEGKGHQGQRQECSHGQRKSN